MTEVAKYGCCGQEKGTPHTPGCRYSEFDEEGNPKPLTPAQKRRQKAATNAADEQAETTFDEPSDDKDDLPDEREISFRSPGLQRMSLDLAPDDRRQMDKVEGVIERKVFDIFTDAYQIMSDIYDVVREAEDDVNPTTGEIQGDGIKRDIYGRVVWKRSPVSGKYYEDWSRLGLKQRENFLFEITTRIFDWEQRRERLWTEAMFAKAIFTERFAMEYDGPMSGTIDDRNAVGNVKAAEDRYYALMQTSVSRRADAIVRTMNSLAQRLKDVIQSG